MKQKLGFAPMAIIVAIIVALSAGTYVAVKKIPKEAKEQKELKTEIKKDKVKNPDEIKTEKNTPKPWFGKSQTKGLFGQLCSGSGTRKLKTFPLDPKDIELITPMGRVQDSHVTPTDHQYIIPKGATGSSLITGDPKRYEVKAPADGYIIQIELFKEPVEQAYRKDPYQDNYLILFEHSCDFYTRLIHIDTLSEKILSSFSFRDPNSQHPFAGTRIAVKEGDIIGATGPHSFDFQIMDTKNKAKNLISPQNIDFFSPSTVDTFKYLEEPLRSELLSKNLTAKEPLGGKIDYDVPGKLAGNWFLVGRSSAREEYWTNNLSVVYDHLDPTQIRISFGKFNGYPKAYGVVGNTPDPAQVGVTSGIVKYELTTFDYFSNGAKWDTVHYLPNLTAKNTNEVIGVVLFQFLDEKTLKVETFPGETAPQVSAFTSNALTYER